MIVVRGLHNQLQCVHHARKKSQHPVFCHLLQQQKFVFQRISQSFCYMPKHLLGVYVFSTGQFLEALKIVIHKLFCHLNPLQFVNELRRFLLEFLHHSILSKPFSIDSHHPFHGVRVGEAQNPGPASEFLVKCCLLNPTAIYNKVDLITSIDSQIYQVAENSATAAIQLVTQQEFRKNMYQSHWSPPVASHAGVAQEEVSFRGQATGVSLHSIHPVRPSRVQVPTDIDATRILSTILQIGTWKIHFVTVYGYPSCHQKSRERTNRLIEAAAMMIDQVNLPAILSGDFNHPIESLGAGQTLIRCGFVNLQKKYQELYAQDMPPTCREVTSPDQVLISNNLQNYITAILVDKQKVFADHDPIIYHLKLPIQPPMRSVWRLPQTWLAYQPESHILEQNFLRLAIQNNLPLHDHDSDQLPSLPDALELWARVVEAAVDATIREQHSQNPEKYPQKHLPKKCRGRVQVRQLKHKPYGEVINAACNGQYDPPGEASNIQLKLVVRQTRRVQSLFYRMQKLEKVTYHIPDHHLQQLLQEWAAISQAKGFGKSFPHWCCNIPELNAFPIVLPSLEYLLDLSQFLKLHADNLSNELQNFRAAKSRFQRNNLDITMERSKIAKQVKGMQFPMVESLQTQVSADIVALRPMQGLVEVDILNETNFRMDCMIQIGEVKCDPIEQIHKTLTLVQRDADEILDPSQKVTQQQWMHEPQKVASSLNDFWNQYWNRDRSTDIDWSEFQRLLDDTPSIDPIQVRVNDPQLWKQAAKLMKSRSARGVDGFLVDELKSLPDSAFQTLAQIFARRPSCAFGSNLSQVITLPLAKTEDPSSPSQTRPITLVAVLYRLWAKTTTMQILKQWQHLIPDYIIGFLPGRSPEIEMIKQQYQFELEHSLTEENKQVWQGLTLDLIKCFNLIGRIPASLALKKSGIPVHLVDTWYNTLQQQTRTWKVNGSLFVFEGTTTGTPEGDSWSVLACIALSRVWANQVVKVGANPACYADNWSLKANSTQITEIAISTTINCAEAMKLLIDWAKTWCWRTSSRGKAEWKQKMQTLLPPGIHIHIVNAARELGYTMAYNKVQSRQTQRQRHDEAIKRITKLRRTRANLQVRAQICADACLSKALFGTVTYHVGNPWIKELRSLIAKTLVPERRNSNPFLATQLLSPFVRDPELHLIIESIRCVRRFLLTLDTEQQNAFYYFLSRHSGSYHDVYGPAGALRANLLRIGWQIDKQGWIQTDTQVQLHLTHDNLPEIIKFVDHCWMKHVMQCRIVRQNWQHFPIPDRTATTKILCKMSPTQQQVLATQITGAYMLGDQRQHIEDAVEACALCGQPEDIYHRILQCPELQHVYIEHNQIVKFLTDHHPCHMYIPVAYQHEDYEFQTWFFRQLPKTELLDAVLDNVQKEILAGYRPMFWTDGSCNTPQHPIHRRASIAIVHHPQIDKNTVDTIVAEYVKNKRLPHSFQVVGASACQGAQNIPRAELQAVCILAQKVDSALIYTDSSYVVIQVENLGYLLDKHKYHKCPNFDLLAKLWDRLQIGDFKVKKVKAHDINPHNDSSFTTFCKIGNEVADPVAKQAREQFERQCPIGETHQDINQVKQNLAFRYQLQVERTKLLSNRQQTSRPLIASKTFQDQLLQLCPSYNNTWSFAIQEQDIQAVRSCLWGTQYSIEILRWLETLQWPTDDEQVAMGISWYELACNFLMVSQKGIVINTGGTGRHFLPKRLCPTSSDVTFSRQAFSFERAITNIQTIVGRRILPMDRAVSTSVRLLGLPVGKSGLTKRPTMLYQDEMVKTLVQHFASGDIPEQVPPLPIKPAAFSVDTQPDDIEHSLDWTLRIRIHNREKKKRHPLA